LKWYRPFASTLPAALAGYDRQQLRRDVGAGFTVATLALPLSLAFAIASGVAPEQGLVTAILGAAVVALWGGSPVQIAGPTGAFVLITYGTLQAHGPAGLVACTLLAGAMLWVLGAVGLGAVIRFLPYPVSRAFTMGIAVLILGSQLEACLGLPTEGAPVQLLAKLRALWPQLGQVHGPTLVACALCVAGMALWPARWARWLPDAVVGLAAATVLVVALDLDRRFGLGTIGSRYGGFSGHWPWPALPELALADWQPLLQPALTIALLAAMQALLCASVTDGLLDRRHDPNRELRAQGLANLIGPLFGALPSTGAVARSVSSVRAGARTPVAALVHCAVLLAVLLFAAPLLVRVPLAALSAVLLVAAVRMVSWSQLVRLRHWPRSDAAVFLATLALTVFADLTLAVEVGVVLAALLMVKRLADTAEVGRVDASNETEGPQHSLVGREVPPGVLVFRVFGPIFFGVVDKLDDELGRLGQVPEVLILRVRKVLAIDATGLQALEDLRRKLAAQGKHLLLSGPQPQPLEALAAAGFLERLGPANVCADVAQALARARELRGLPPAEEPESMRLAAERIAAPRRALAEAS
jgi:SulP family sulfate permease